jgi:hypothetical protein
MIDSRQGLAMSDWLGGREGGKKDGVDHLMARH